MDPVRVAKSVHGNSALEPNPSLLVVWVWRIVLSMFLPVGKNCIPYLTAIPVAIADAIILIRPVPIGNVFAPAKDHFLQTSATHDWFGCVFVGSCLGLDHA